MRRSAYTPFTPSKSGQRSLPTYYRGCWHVVSRSFLSGYRPISSPLTAVYDPKTFIPHAASLRQAFAHCAKFLTAASRRSLARISVPVWPIILSDRLPVEALVSHYLTNKLIGRRPLIWRITAFFFGRCLPKTTSGITWPFGQLSQTKGHVIYALLTRLPLGIAPPHDLHVLGTPPALVLSQDQTLHKELFPRRLLSIAILR
jgi:hypothetical protein